MHEEWLVGLRHGLGNLDLKEIMTACAVFFGVWIALHCLYRFVLKRLSNWVGRVSHHQSELINRLVATIHPGLFPILALFAALTRLEVGPWQRRALEVIVGGILLVQALQLGNRLIEDAMSRLQAGRSDGKKVEQTKSNLVALAKVLLWTVAALFFLDNFGINVSTFVAGLGIGGIAVALAAQAVLGDTFGSFTISLDKPFDVGDSITAGNVTGTVLDVGLKTTRIRSLTGELWVVPNSELTKASLQNFSDMKERRVVLKLGFTYDTSLPHLEGLPAQLKAIISGTEKVRFDRAHFCGFGDSSLNFEVVWYVLSGDYTLYMDKQQEIGFKVMRYCLENEIEFAFPTRTLVMAPAESADKS